MTGTAFDLGATVTFGAIMVARSGYDPRVAGSFGGSLIVNAPPHSPGLVDIIVTNPDRQAHRLVNAFEYRAQQSFDLNGDWGGGGSGGSHIEVALTIRNDVLVIASWACDGGAFTTVDLSSPAEAGEFDAAAAGGFRISGRIVSPADAIGRITLPTCGGEHAWVAGRVKD